GGPVPLRQRMEQFVSLTRATAVKQDAQVLQAIDRAFADRNWWQQFKKDIEISEFRYTGPQLVLMTLAAMVVLGFILAIALPPIFVIFAFIVPPFVARGLVKRKLNAKREEFAD